MGTVSKAGFAIRISQVVSYDVNRLADVALLNHGERPDCRQQFVVRHQSTSMAQQVHERAERLLGKSAVAGAVRTREPTFAYIEAKAAEFVDLRIRFGHGCGGWAEQERKNDSWKSERRNTTAAANLLGVRLLMATPRGRVSNEVKLQTMC